MALPISPERLHRRTQIASALREHGPQTSRQIYSRCPDMPDITECCRLIGEMRKAGELASDEIEATDEQRAQWGLTPSPPRVVKVHRLINGHDHIPVSADVIQAEAELWKMAAQEPEPDPVTSAEFEAPTHPAADIVLDRDDEPDPLFWYSSEGELRIGYEGDVPIALRAKDVETLVAFMRRVGLVK